jgi:hypothetical protein
VSPVKYEIGFYITEDDILHSHIGLRIIHESCDAWLHLEQIPTLSWSTICKDFTRMYITSFPATLAIVLRMVTQSPGLRDFSAVCNSNQPENTTFRDADMFPSSGEKTNTTIVWGSLPADEVRV